MRVADPGVGVDTVGDRPDRHLVDRHVRPQPLEHLPAHLAVQRGDAVRPRREAQAHHRHVEPVLVGLVGAAADGEQLVERDAALRGEAAEVLLHQLRREPVDAGGHRGVGGEHAAGPHGFDGLGERQPTGDVLADALEREEPGVTLVGVEDLRVQAERAQRTHAADAEDDLLAQPVLDVAAVEPVGDAGGLGLLAGRPVSSR